MYQWLNTSLTVNVGNLQTITHVQQGAVFQWPATPWQAFGFADLCKVTNSVSLLGHCPQMPAGLCVTVYVTFGKLAVLRPQGTNPYKEVCSISRILGENLTDFPASALMGSELSGNTLNFPLPTSPTRCRREASRVRCRWKRGRMRRRTGKGGNTGNVLFAQSQCPGHSEWGCIRTGLNDPLIARPPFLSKLSQGLSSFLAILDPRTHCHLPKPATGGVLCKG